MANWLTDLIGRLPGSAKSTPEGQPHSGPWLVHRPDGVLPDEWGRFLNFWQMDYDPITGGSSAVIEACINAYAQTMAMCPGDQWRGLPDGGRERVTNSALSRILRNPNDYQSRSDFVLGLGRDLYSEGNTYALGLRNDRFEVNELHPFDPKESKPVIAGNGEIFYELNGNTVIEKRLRARLPDGFIVAPGNRLLAPARNVLHVKLDTRNGNPLLGTAPRSNAMAAMYIQNLIAAELVNFFANRARPGGVLETENTLTEPQVAELRKRWDEASRGMNAGGTPILTNGLKFHGISATASDAELVEAYKLSRDDIFMVYGIPPAIIGMTDKGSFASTEALMQFWLSRGLGFALNHVETAIEQFFGLKGWPDEYVEFDTKALLRVAFKDRIEALARGTQGGIFSPDEARNAEELPDVKGGAGEEPRMQTQMVPLSAWDKVPPKTPSAPAAPAAMPPLAGDEPETSETSETSETMLDPAMSEIIALAAIEEEMQRERAAA